MPLSGLAGMGAGGGMNIPGTIGGGSMGGGGGTDFPQKKPSSWWALAAGPIAALLGSAVGGMDYGEALANFGQGFANQKYETIKQRRKQEFDEENRVRDLAHESVMNLKNLTPEVIQKFPKLQSLSQKYQDALANDGKISPKEAQELIVFSKMAEADMAMAQNDQRGATMTQDFRTRETAEENLNAERLGGAFPGTEGADIEQLRNVGQSLMDQQRIAELPELTSVGIGDETREIMMTPIQRFQLAKEEERAKRAAEVERRRQETEERVRQSQEGAAARAERGLGMREEAADFREQMAEWRDRKQAALEELAIDAGGKDYIKPEDYRRVMEELEAMRPRRAGSESIAPFSDVVSGGSSNASPSKRYSNVRPKN